MSTLSKYLLFYLAQKVKIIDAEPIINDLYSLLAIFRESHLDVGRASIDRIVD